MKEHTSPRSLKAIFLLELLALVFALWILQSTERTETVRVAVQSGLAWLSAKLP
jgi:hypothetical protein